MIELFFAVVLWATADRQTYSAEYEACMAGEARTWPMVDCINAEFERQNSRMQLALDRALINNLTESEAERLATAQAAWVVYRDAHCDAYLGDGNWGQLSRVEAASCMLDLTHDRADELEFWANHER